MATGAFSKFIRPKTPARAEISDRDLDILATVLRYRFSSAAQLVRLVGGNEDVTHRHLRRLWEWQLINRFAFPGIRTHSEFFYYLDNRQALELLAERRGLEFTTPYWKSFADTARRIIAVLPHVANTCSSDF